MRLRSLVAVGAATALVASMAVLGAASPTHRLELFQTGHWVFNAAERVAYHISGSANQVDAKTQPLGDMRGPTQVVQGASQGFVVSENTIVSFGKSTLVVDATTAALGSEEPLAIETAGGPYLVYRAKGSVVRLGAALGDPVEVGGPVDQAVADAEGNVWLERSDVPLLCLLARDSEDVVCDTATPRSHLGSPTIIDGRPSFVDTTASTVSEIRPGRLGTPTPLGSTLQPDALVAAHGPVGSVAAINPGHGTLVIAPVPGREGRRPVVVPLGKGPFAAPLASDDAVVVLDRGRRTVITIGLDGRERDRADAPGRDDPRLTRGQDGRVYVDAQDGARSLIADRDGRLSAVSVAAVQVASAPPEPQVPPPVSPAPLIPPRPDQASPEDEAPDAEVPPVVPRRVPVPAPPPDQGPETPRPPRTEQPPAETPPGKPEITGTTPLGSEVAVAFRLPRGGTVTSITVDVTGDAPASVDVPPGDRTAVLPLVCGNTGTVTVTVQGPGGASTSDPVDGVVSCRPPGQPTITGTTGGNGWISVTFDATPSDGVTYEVSVDGATVLTGQAPGTTGRIGVANGTHEVVVIARSPAGATSASAPAAATAQQLQVFAYDNYGSGGAGFPMCRGNPGAGTSMPGGQVTQTLTVPNGVRSINTALIQIDPSSAVTAHLQVLVNGVARASASALAGGDTTFGFGDVPVAAGDTVTLSLGFSSTAGTIITVYPAGSPGGTLTISNSCAASTTNTTTSGVGLRARVSGWND